MRKRHLDGEPEDDKGKKELATATVGSQEPRDPFPSVILAKANLQPEIEQTHLSPAFG
jgi:hypothetical protein